MITSKTNSTTIKVLTNLAKVEILHHNVFKRSLSLSTNGIKKSSNKLIIRHYLNINVKQYKNQSTRNLTWLMDNFSTQQSERDKSTSITKKANMEGSLYHEKIILGYSRQQMCDLVYDVSRYKEFVPFCTNSEIIENDEAPTNNKLNLKLLKNQTTLSNFQKFNSKNLNSQQQPKQQIQLPQSFKARLKIGYPPINESYVSHVTMMHPHMVKAISRDTALFNYLINEWKFHPYDLETNPAKLTLNKVNDNGTEQCCVVEFYVSFKFNSIIYAELSSMFMDAIFKKMVGAFKSRAESLYGTPSIK